MAHQGNLIAPLPGQHHGIGIEGQEYIGNIGFKPKAFKVLYKGLVPDGKNLVALGPDHPPNTLGKAGGHMAKGEDRLCPAPNAYQHQAVQIGLPRKENPGPFVIIVVGAYTPYDRDIGGSLGKHIRVFIPRKGHPRGAKSEDKRGFFPKTAYPMGRSLIGGYHLLLIIVAYKRSWDSRRKETVVGSQDNEDQSPVKAARVLKFGQGSHAADSDPQQFLKLGAQGSSVAISVAKQYAQGIFFKGEFFFDRGRQFTSGRFRIVQFVADCCCA
ncbi:hypothetical protein MALL_0843 [Mycoplasmopsis alligatoris A21JP2]|uniref:Uncharacterized protein n=1 Tax=Mycoplasmopsis alligatoris A21JP2 TaxID=747682 RepID=D4XWA6_9BACT|nr:hypothetical protein MALL_0843 [Mycoplasmopsis alligatoris A21JP2]